MVQIERTRTLLFSVLLFGTALVNACESVPPEYKAFFTRDWARQKEEARKFPTEKQIDYYFAGRKYVHLPSLNIAVCYCRAGCHGTTGLRPVSD